MRKRTLFHKVKCRRTCLLGMFGYRPVVYMPKVSGFRTTVTEVLMVGFD